MELACMSQIWRLEISDGAQIYGKALYPGKGKINTVQIIAGF
jgi:hypothetical protein